MKLLFHSYWTEQQLTSKLVRSRQRRQLALHLRPVWIQVIWKAVVYSLQFYETMLPELFAKWWITLAYTYHKTYFRVNSITHGGLTCPTELEPNTRRGCSKALVNDLANISSLDKEIERFVKPPVHKSPVKVIVIRTSTYWWAQELTAMDKMKPQLTPLSQPKPVNLP